MPSTLKNMSNFGLPPFTRAVKWIVVACCGIFILQAVLNLIHPGADLWIYAIFGLVPAAVTHGWLWQLITYGFVHEGITHILFNMLGVWMFGASIEQAIGTRRFTELYFFSLIGSALIAIGLTYAHILHINPFTPTVGASGAVMALIVAFGILFAEQEITILILFILPLTMKAKYLAMGTIFIVVAAALTQGGPANLVHFGGLLMGYIYIKLIPRYGLLTGTTEKIYGIRNAYYRWRRRRAARKFKVYMKQHGREVYFDEYGNYRPPNGREDDRKGPWVN